MEKFNENLRQLALLYKQSGRQEKKREILEKIYFTEKNFIDYLEMLNIARVNNLDLDFHKAIIDSFFETPFSEFSLLLVYKKLKGRVFENYFSGCLQRKNMTFKTLENLYSKLKEDSDLATIVFNIMVNTAISLDNFIFLLCQDKLDKELEAKLLTEVKRQNGCLNFWVRAFEKAKPNSALFTYADNLLRQKVAKRSFESVHEFYMENIETKAAPILLEILADLAKSEKELDLILYLSKKDHKAFKIAEDKKKKLE